MPTINFFKNGKNHIKSIGNQGLQVLCSFIYSQVNPPSSEHRIMKPFAVLAQVKSLVLACLCTSVTESVAAPKQAQDFALALTDSGILKQWSRDGLSFESQFQASSTSTNELYRSSKMYRDVFESINEDLVDQSKEVPLRSVTATQESPIELFKLSWLNAPTSRFELVAIIHRFDRRFIAACGEIRLVYRLTYQLNQTEGPEYLPATMMLAYPAADIVKSTDCRVVAKALQLPLDPRGKHALLAYRKQIASIFSPETPQFSQLEVNLQISRWPSTSDLSFVQQAHYLLRVFKRIPGTQHLYPHPLENTPDVARLAKQPQLATALQSWLEEPTQLQALDEGTLIIPDRFLATRTISVSPFGSVRLANQPFSAIFKPSDKLTANRLHRLDLFSCNGCHQSQALAGFHVLGDEGTAVPGRDFTLFEPFSVHFLEVQDWRKSDLKRFLENKPVKPTPAPDRALNGGHGDTCSSRLQDYGCKEGFSCDTKHSMSADQSVGECLPRIPSAIVGQPCDPSHLTSNTEPLRDRVTDLVIEQSACGKPHVCASARAGFPGGFCSGDCREVEGGLCVAVPVLGDFSICLQETARFRDCAQKHHMKVKMPRCHHNADCRQDYACVNTGSSSGYCAPLYFLPGLTLGHHPTLSEPSQP